MTNLKRYLYHFTHIGNLESILTNKGLYSSNEMKVHGLDYQDIAHDEIQNRRSNTNVPVPPYGNLHDYVPFYFAPRSPMMYLLVYGQLEKYVEGQDSLIYLVTNIASIKNKQIPFVFTDGHAIMGFTEFYNELDQLANIDWELMKSKYWKDTQEDPDRKRRRQAEFLVKEFVPWDLIIGVGVNSNNMKYKVEEALTNFGFKTNVKVLEQWYF